MNLGPGEHLGPYELLSELGRGGMGVVFRARDARLGRFVALKTLGPEAPPSARERLIREARAAALLRHPTIVPVLEANVYAGVPVVAFELVAGSALSARLRQAGPLAAHEAARLVHALALAVQAAHDQGVIHRDLKPANVLVEEDGRPRLTDFGLARDERVDHMTKAGQPIGTPAYMSPEQADGLEATALSDVYGLGAVLYETLAGRPPFDGPSAILILTRVLRERPAPLSVARRERGLARVPLDLETICMKALEKEPRARYESARALAQDLERFMAGRPVLARPAPLLRRGAFWLRRNRALALLGTVALLLAAGTAALVGQRIVERSRRKGEESDRRAREEAARREEDARAASAHVASARARLAGRAPLLVHAEEELLQAIQLAPRDAEAWRLLAETHLLASAHDRANGGTDAGARGHAELALRHAERAVALAPRSAAALVLRARARLRAAAFSLGATAAEAESHAALALELDPRSTDALVARARAREADGRHAEALADAEAALALDARSAAALVLRATLEGEDAPGQDRAFELLSRAVLADPGCHEAWRLRGYRQYWRKRDFEAAVADETRAIELDATRSNAWITRAYSQFALGRFEAASEDATRALALHPGDHEALLTRGHARVKLGRNDEAMRDALLVLDAGSRNEWAWIVLREACHGLAEDALFLVLASRAAEREPENLTARRFQGLALLDAGRRDDALAVFQSIAARSSAAEPEGKIARDYVSKLEGR